MSFNMKSIIYYFCLFFGRLGLQNKVDGVSLRHFVLRKYGRKYLTKSMIDSKRKSLSGYTF